MKRLFLLMFFCTIISQCFSQSLEGEWKGTFTAYLPSRTTVNESYKNEIKIEIILNSDSTYTIYSYAGEPYARGHFTDYKCEISYTMLSEEDIFLVETKVVQPENATSCLKKMNLKIIKRKKSISLEGTWQTNAGDCDNAGSITVSKKL